MCDPNEWLNEGLIDACLWVLASITVPGLILLGLVLLWVW